MGVQSWKFKSFWFLFFVSHMFFSSQTGFLFCISFAFLHFWLGVEPIFALVKQKLLFDFEEESKERAWRKEEPRSKKLYKTIIIIMSFTGTQQKCKACDKTVYPVEQLSADGVSYHKSCFKCSHCKGTLKVLCCLFCPTYFIVVLRIYL